MKRIGDYTDIVKAANKLLARDGAPYRFGVSGIALCPVCGLAWFPNDRQYPACEHNLEWQS